ncbi:hypothetical protein CAPTEDRAFT_205374 [Capitella teleta]|uniref:EGF-like domain-containing protein n=1 Tax=Capitella teleta TaxID=283909 RepID=R7TMY4_CAPTE|nr:hypothetical protein CAPTEDRAFT_205374 [Capitella teleta]|eukprot:ELT94872.1 hypothetical protein CAPTEDRAFT_205374 [Capitella teleta]
MYSTYERYSPFHLAYPRVEVVKRDVYTEEYVSRRRNGCLIATITVIMVGIAAAAIALGVLLAQNKSRTESADAVVSPDVATTSAIPTTAATCPTLPLFECPIGYELREDGVGCKDVDECLVLNGGCGMLCKNSEGSFFCSCDEGFQLGSDQRTCNDINECDFYNGGCSHKCVNEEGSYSCQCPFDHVFNKTDRKTCHEFNCNPGYNVAPDGLECIDTNECNSKDHGCEKNCINTLGSFKCTCDKDELLMNDKKSCTSLPATMVGYTDRFDRNRFFQCNIDNKNNNKKFAWFDLDTKGDWPSCSSSCTDDCIAVMFVSGLGCCIMKNHPSFKCLSLDVMNGGYMAAKNMTVC